MLEFIMQPWPWWFSGVLVGLTVPLLFLLAGKAFGISTSLQQIGAMCAPGSRASYLRDYDWREGLWTLGFVGGHAGLYTKHIICPSAKHEHRHMAGAENLGRGAADEQLPET
jgi:hypothetical protein